jgi:hypothetical protein
MAKCRIALLAYALFSSCSYDAGRLLRPDKESSVADAARTDTPVAIRANDTREADTRDGAIQNRDDAVCDACKSATDGKDADIESGVVSGKNTEATFVSGRAQGALTGYGYVSLGVVDSITSPTCNGMQIGGLAPSDPPVTFNSTCRPSAITWGSATGLCVSGTIPGWSSYSSHMDSMIDWGIMVGVATRQPVQTMGVSYGSIALTVSGWNSESVLAVVHLADDASNLTYCASMTSGVAIKLQSFNTECIFSSGRGLADKDVERIDKIGVQVPSSRSVITLSDFCLTKIEFPS